nr:7TM diverse intracellular signaling domain-containing protein [Variovorax terrae]
MLLGAVLSLSALARTALELDTARQPVNLDDWGDAWIDTGGKAQPAQVDRDPSLPWQPTRGNAIYAFAAGQALWVRFTLPPSPDNERWYLELPYPSVNLVSLYRQDGAGQWDEQRAGDTLAVNTWPVPHRHPLMPVALSAETPRRYLLRIENPYGFSAPLRFVSESYLSYHEQRVSLILGIYFGLAGLAALLAALSAVSLRDRAYALYAPSVALMALTQASMTGIAGLHLWPGLAWWNDVSSLVLPVLTLISLLLFVSAVVSMRERSRHFHAGLIGLAVLGALVAIGIMVIEPQHRLWLLVPYTLLTQVAGLLALFWSWRRGDRFAPWLVLGALPVIGAAALPIARICGLVPVSFATMYGMQIGIAFELPVLLVILMLRSQQRREHNRRIHGMDRMDPATGLINGHVLTERLQRMIGRSERLHHQSAVLLIDIVNIEQIQRGFDRKSAEELPLRVAGRLLATARSIDSVARLSEYRFGMLVEGPLTSEEAAAVGPRLVARCLMPFRNKPPEWVAQLRVVWARVPQDSGDATALLERLGSALGAVPRDSRRAVFPLRE